MTHLYCTCHHIGSGLVVASSRPERQADFEGAALTRPAIHGYFAAVILDDALADRQPQAETAFFLGGVKGLEDFRQFLLVHAGAGISDGNDQRRWIFLAALRADPQRTALGHGVDGV
jgi:hypothetical protein